MREIYLTSSPEQMSVSVDSSLAPVFGVIGEYAYEDLGHALVVGFLDGKSRLITADRSGEIGTALLGGEVPHDERSGAAARAVVRAANACHTLFAPDESAWQPETGKARITLLTTQGRGVLERPLAELEHAQPPLDAVANGLWDLSSALRGRLEELERLQSGK